MGKHGPATQIGAALASGLASLLALRPEDRREVVVCWISAGFAAVFGTPIAGCIFGLDRGTAAALGMVSLVAGAANTPLAASVMAIELFGPAVGPLAALVCIVSFVMAGHRSVFGTQVLGTTKSGSLRARSGAELSHAAVVRAPRP